MDLCYDSTDADSDVLSLGGGTLAEEAGVIVEHEEFLGAGSSQCTLSQPYGFPTDS